MKKLVSAGLAAVALSACATYDPGLGTTSRSNARTGALTGAVLGAAIGCALNDDDCTKNAMIGAAVGGAAGAGVGEYMRRQQLALQQRLSNTGVGIQREGDNIRLIMPGNVTFATNSDQIDPRFAPVLNDVAAIFNQYPATRIQITGHTDNVGSAAYNQQLSLRRATSVGNYIASQGVSPDRIFAYGAGLTQPKASNATDEGRAANRRVEILLIPANA